MPKQETINLRVDREVKEEIYSFAKLKKKSLSDYISSEIIEKLRDNFIKCPKCESPVLDKRDSFLTGKVNIICPGCKEKFSVNF
jgi:formylmethanofuran dehydrogenase subunit E